MEQRPGSNAGANDAGWPGKAALPERQEVSRARAERPPGQRPPLWLSLLVMAISLPLLIPFAYILLRSSEVGLERAISLIFRERVWTLLGNTMTLLVLVSSISVVLGTASAFLLERYRIFGKTFFSVAATLPLCIPAFVAGFSWISLSFRFSGLPGSVLVMTMVSAPLVYLPVAAVLRRMDRSLEEVSLSMGRGRVHTFWHVIFPQLKPALGSGFLLIALHLLIEFGAVSVMNYQTFTTAIFQEYDMSFDNATAALLSLVLVIICLIVVRSEMLFRGAGTHARKGRGVARQPEPRPLAPHWHALAILFFATQFVLGVGMPLVMVGYWVSVGTSLGSSFDMSEFLQSIGLSMGVSLGGALVTVLAAMPLVWCAVRYRSLLTIWIDRLPFLLHAVPGIVIALGLIFFSIRFAYPIYQTFIPVMLAYLMLYLPMAQTTLKASLEQVPMNMENVGRSLGRSNFHVFRTLLVPMILPGITAAFALVFLNLMKELTATLVLMPTNVQTMAVSVWDRTLDGSYAAVAPYALALIVFSGIPVFLLRRYAFN